MRIDFAAIRAAKQPKEESLYAALVAAGIPIGSHESDIYFPVTEETKAILKRFPLQKANAEVFKNQVEGGLWYDVPFAYLPFWDKRMREKTGGEGKEGEKEHH